MPESAEAIAIPPAKPPALKLASTPNGGLAKLRLLTATFGLSLREICDGTRHGMPIRFLAGMPHRLQ